MTCICSHYKFLVANGRMSPAFTNIFEFDSYLKLFHRMLICSINLIYVIKGMKLFLKLFLISLKKNRFTKKLFGKSLLKCDPAVHNSIGPGKETFKHKIGIIFPPIYLNICIGCSNKNHLIMMVLWRNKKINLQLCRLI